MLTVYVVLESTPGYLPDDLEPFATTNRADAERHAAALARELYDDLAERYAETRDPDDRPRRSGSARAGRIDVDTDRPHDLGRVVTIETLTGDDAATAFEQMNAAP